jgi:hypothetical protein
MKAQVLATVMMKQIHVVTRLELALQTFLPIQLWKLV